MINSLWFSIFVCAFLAAPSLIADELDKKSTQQLYTEGLGLYQTGEWSQAEELWSAALSQEPQNPLILHNLALASLRLQKPGLAVGLWRKALTLNPSMSAARRALDFALKQLPQPLPESSSAWVNFKQKLSFISPLLFFTLLTFFFFFSLWLWLSFLEKRKNNQDAAAGFPYLASLCSVFCIPLVFFSVIRWQDMQIRRATVIEKTTALRSGPAADQTILFELTEGSEVHILRKEETDSEVWLQVSYPGGLSGWTPQSSLFQTSGEFL